MAPVPLPPPPDVKDAMLEPIPEAPNQLASWRQALELVRQRSTTLKISRAGVEQAGGLKRQALAGTLPSLTGTAAVNRHLLLGRGPSLEAGGAVRDLPDPSTIFQAGLDLRQPVLALGTWHAIGTAKDRVRVAELSAKDTERLLLAAVADAAVTVITATRISEASRVALGSALSTLDLTRRRAALGAASAVDVLRVEQEVALSRAQVVESSETLRRAREALGVTLGDTNPWAVSPSIRAEELVRTTGELCKPIPSLESRSDLQAAQGRVDAARRDISNIDYTYVPTIDLVSSLDYTSSRFATANREHMTWTVGGVLAWPLYDGGDRYGQTRQREAAETIAREELTQKKRDATLEVTQSERSVSVAEATLAVATETSTLAEKSSRLARIAFENGSGTSFDLVDQARRLREAEIDRLIKEFEVVKARIAAFIARANCSI
jgi:outer membrane protein, multidrug efflux system